MHAGQPLLTPSPCARQCPSRQRCRTASGESTAPRKKTWDLVEAPKTYACFFFFANDNDDERPIFSGFGEESRNNHSFDCIASPSRSLPVSRWLLLLLHARTMLPSLPHPCPQAIAVEDVVWIRLFNVLYRKHKSWMRQQGTPPTWDKDKASERGTASFFSPQLNLSAYIIVVILCSNISNTSLRKNDIIRANRNVLVSYSYEVQVHVWLLLFHCYVARSSFDIVSWCTTSWHVLVCS